MREEMYFPSGSIMSDARRTRVVVVVVLVVLVERLRRRRPAAGMLSRVVGSSETRAAMSARLASASFVSTECILDVIVATARGGGIPSSFTAVDCPSVPSSRCVVRTRVGGWDDARGATVSLGAAGRAGQAAGAAAAFGRIPSMVAWLARRRRSRRRQRRR